MPTTFYLNSGKTAVPLLTVPATLAWDELPDELRKARDGAAYVAALKKLQEPFGGVQTKFIGGACTEYFFEDGRLCAASDSRG